uniref:Protein Wnt n=1 Tax=Glossina austeni TaxID=7395 RepID=A0A1A9UV98_GLOAU
MSFHLRNWKLSLIQGYHPVYILNQPAIKSNRAQLATRFLPELENSSVVIKLHKSHRYNKTADFSLFALRGGLGLNSHLELPPYEGRLMFTDLLTLEKRHSSPEMAFIHALAAATVTSFIARACRDGQLASCGCSSGSRPKQLNDDWTWGGCGDNLEYAYK